MLEEDKILKRIERHKETQEDFTPNSVVNDLLDRFPKEAFTDMRKTIIDYSAGNGNLLIEAYDRKLDNSKNIDDAIVALMSIYGVELMADNVEECRERLYNLLISRYPKVKSEPEVDKLAKCIIINRIQWYNSLKFDYDNWPEITIYSDPDFKVPQTELDTKYPMWFRE